MFQRPVNARALLETQMKLRLFLVALSIAVTVPAGATPVLEPDVAITDDQTTVMIDVLANDHGSGGRPMVLKAVRALNCPGSAFAHSGHQGAGRCVEASGDRS